MKISLVFLACIVHLQNVERRIWKVNYSWCGWDLELGQKQLLIFLKFLCQASEDASLRALESLMTEFFHDCTTNERKREIGKWGVGRKALIPLVAQTCMCP